MPRQSLFTNPKFLRAVRRLGIPEPHLLGHLEYVWRVAYESGSPVIGDAEDVEAVAKWDGKAGTFAAVLVKCRFLDRVKGGKLAVHDLYDHAPEHVRKRMDREAERQAAGVTLKQRRSDAARQAAQARWKNGDASCLPRGSQSMPRGSLRGEERSREKKRQSRPSVRTANRRPRPARGSKPDTATAGGGFDEFWTAYPKPVKKLRAQAAWTKLRPDAATRKAIMAALAVCTDSAEWTRNNGQFIPHPATWLNDRRWEDESEPARRRDPDDELDPDDIKPLPADEVRRKLGYTTEANA